VRSYGARTDRPHLMSTAAIASNTALPLHNPRAPVRSQSLASASAEGVKRELEWATVVEHLDVLYRVARMFCRSTHDAQDLVQEVCVRLLSHPRRLRIGGERAYMTVAVRNTFLEGLRSQATRPHTVEFDKHSELLASTSPSPHDVLEAREIFALLSRLPDHYRDVIAAVEVAGLSYAEAAEALGVPVGTVMSRLHRARSSVAAAVDAER
jgi:RNA polymerase sigma-70 factor (ECF subfamily)